MIDIKLSPPREGTRGGRDHFKWEDVKNQCTNERDYYLGHSVKIGVPKRRDYFYRHDWYLKPQAQDSDDKVADEVELVKLYEKIVMDELVGKRPKKLTLLKQRPNDLEQLRTLVQQVTRDDDTATAPCEPGAKRLPKSHAKDRSSDNRKRHKRQRVITSHHTSSSRSSSHSSISQRDQHRHRRGHRRDSHERDCEHYRRHSSASKSRSRSYSLNRRRHRHNHRRDRHSRRDHRRDEGGSRYSPIDRRARGPRD